MFDVFNFKYGTVQIQEFVYNTVMIKLSMMVFYELNSKLAISCKTRLKVFFEFY